MKKGGVHSYHTEPLGAQSLLWAVVVAQGLLWPVVLSLIDGALQDVRPAPGRPRGEIYLRELPSTYDGERRYTPTLR